MLINVYNSVSFRNETIDTVDFDSSVHFHCATRKPFLEEDAATFSADKPKKKAKKEEPLEPIVTEDAEEVTE